MRQRAADRWRAARARHFWLDHLVLAGDRYLANRGNQFAGAITYFSFLALFPLILLGVAVTAYVLRANPDQLTSLRDHVTSAVPGGLGDTLKSSIDQAIKQRASVGVVGAIGVLYTGLGWVGNLRAAIDAVWGVQRRKRNIVLAKAADLLVLAGLGVGLAVSLALTAGGTALTDQVLQAIGMSGAGGVHPIARALGIGLAIVGDVLVFSWLLARLPRVEPPIRTVLRGALFAAIGFEILKVVGAVYISRVSNSLTAGIFGSVIGLLVWINLVARYLLFSTAWMATGGRAAPPVSDVPSVDSVARPPRTAVRAVSPLALAACLVGAGAAIGAGATALFSALSARRRGRRGAARSFGHSPRS